MTTSMNTGMNETESTSMAMNTKGKSNVVTFRCSILMRTLGRNTQGLKLY
jgi:hypothetical protein